MCCPHDHRTVPVRGSYDVTAMCLRARGLRVMLSCVFNTFQYGVLAQECYLIVLIPDLCLIPFFDIYNNNKTERMQETPESDKMFS